MPLPIGVPTVYPMTNKISPQESDQISEQLAVLLRKYDRLITTVTDDEPAWLQEHTMTSLVVELEASVLALRPILARLR